MQLLLCMSILAKSAMKYELPVQATASGKETLVPAADTGKREACQVADMSSLLLLLE